MNDIIGIVQELDMMLDNAMVISDYDRSVYLKRYGEDAVAIIERQAEILAEPNHNIQAMINIAYDKGFVDCVEMVKRVLSKHCIHEEASS